MHLMCAGVDFGVVVFRIGTDILNKTKAVSPVK